MKRVFHYTTVQKLELIVKDGVIKPTDSFIAENERPVVWLSLNPVYERTAFKARFDSVTGMVQTLTFDEMVDVGFARIALNEADFPMGWKDFKALSGCPREAIMGLEKAAKVQHSNPSEWRISFDPIPSGKWAMVEIIDKETKDWVPFKGE
jgi:hypothetical protein